MPASFEGYLEQWPDGVFASFPGLKLEELSATAAGEFPTPVSESQYEIDSQTTSVAEDLRVLLGREFSAFRVDEDDFDDWTRDGETRCMLPRPRTPVEPR